MYSHVMLCGRPFRFDLSLELAIHAFPFRLRLAVDLAWYATLIPLLLYLSTPSLSVYFSPRFPFVGVRFSFNSEAKVFSGFDECSFGQM